MVVKGFFPRGEEWVFIPKSPTLELFHFQRLEMFTLYLRRQVGENGSNFVFNKLPSEKPVVEHLQIHVRRLAQHEILTFAEAYREAKLAMMTVPEVSFVGVSMPA